MCNVNNRDTGDWLCGDSTIFTIFPINVKLSQEAYFKEIKRQWIQHMQWYWKLLHQISAHILIWASIVMWIKYWDNVCPLPIPSLGSFWSSYTVNEQHGQVNGLRLYQHILNKYLITMPVGMKRAIFLFFKGYYEVV